MSAPQLLGAAGLIVTAVAVHAGLQSPSQQQLPDDWRARFSAAALQIPFDSERAPVPDSGVPRGAYPKKAPKMWIAAAKTSDTGRVGHVVFRIRSEAPYPGLGFDSGFNYLWQDVKNGKSREFVIPADPAKPVRSLVVTPHEHYKVPKGPRLLVVEREEPAAAMRPGHQPLKTYLALATCKRCSDGTWCISNDTTPKRVMVDVATIESMKAYYARNKVVWASR